MTARSLVVAFAVLATLAVTPIRADHTFPFHKGYRGGCISGPHFGHHRPYRGAVSGHVGLHYSPYGSSSYSEYHSKSYSAYGGSCGPRYYPPRRTYDVGYTAHAGAYRSYGSYSTYHHSYGHSYGQSYGGWYGDAYGGRYSGRYRHYGPAAFEAYPQTSSEGLPWRVRMRQRLAAAQETASAPGAPAPAGEVKPSSAPAAPAAPTDKTPRAPRPQKRGYLYYPDTGEVVDGSRAGVPVSALAVTRSERPSEEKKKLVVVDAGDRSKKREGESRSGGARR